MKQIKMLAEQHELLKSIAKDKEKDLYVICGDAVEKFIKGRLNNKHTNQYLASPRSGEYRSYWLEASALKNVPIVCEMDVVSESRVIYTAFFHYLQKQGRHLTSLH